MDALLIYHEVREFSSPLEIPVAVESAAVGAGHGLATPGLVNHIGEGKARQVLAHVITDVGPHAEQDALAFVIAGTVLVGFAEVARRNRPVDRRDDLGQRDGLRRASQNVTAAHASLGANKSRALKAQEDLFQIRLGETGTPGEVTNRRGRAVIIAKGQTQ